jgi:hypothetical protein
MGKRGERQAKAGVYARMNAKPLSATKAFLLALTLSGGLAGMMLAGCTSTGGSTTIQPPTPPGLPTAPAVTVPNPPGFR